VNDADFLDLGNVEVSTLLGEALHLAAFKAGLPTLNATLDFHKQFLTAAADQNDRFKQSAYYRKYMGLDLQKVLRPIRRAQQGAA
jgi:hypothetical protein